MLLNEVRTGENLISFFYTPFLLAFDFLYPFPFFSFFLFVILLDVLFVNNLLFKSILIQLSTFKINNIFLF